MSLTKTFQELGRGDAGIAGGKGASLGELTRAGIPVPPGFVVLAETYRRFLDETDLEPQIKGELDKVNIEDTASVERASETIRGIFAATPVPEDIQSTIVSEFETLGAEFVAVRSSATAEDAADASWAGELESYLYSTHSTLVENVKNCWSSLFTPRAIFYRTEKGMKDHDVAVAVVVQKMVASEVSGICFTVHPVTQDHNQLIIEAGWGLGEAIVGGMITPDSYVVDKRDGTVLDIHQADQTMQIVRKAEGGTEERDVESDKRNRQKLSHEQILEFTELAKKIETHYGAPQDIEWALEAGKFYVVQSRPITTLKT